MQMSKSVPESRTNDRRPARAAGWRLGAVLVTVALVVAGTGVAAQADYYSGGMPTRSFNYRTEGINDTWVGFYRDGNNRWNTSGARTSIGLNSGAAAWATAGNYSAAWWGLYTPYGIRGLNRTFRIQQNARTLARDAGSNLAEWCRGNSVHELGHALSLADNPNTTRVTVMDQGVLATVRFPMAYDIEEVERIY
jgi:hypothetical protein